MTSQNPKIRLVRCPKCLTLLAELPELTVYKCGGCGTVLQAKNHKKDINGAGLCSNDAKKALAQHVPKDEEVKSPNLEAIVPPSGESALHKSTEMHQSKIDYCDRVNASFSDGHCDSAELTVQKNRKSSLESQVQEVSDKEKFPLDSHAVRHHNEVFDYGKNHSGDIYYDALASSTELTGHEYEQSSPESQATMEANEEKCLSSQDSGRDQIEFGGYSEQQSGLLSDSTELTCGSEPSSPESQAHIDDILLNQCCESDKNALADCIDEPSGNTSNEASPSSGADTTETKTTTFLEQHNEGDHSDFRNVSRKQLRNTEVMSSTELACQETEKETPAAKEETKVDVNTNDRHSYKYPSEENLPLKRARDSVTTSKRLTSKDIEIDSHTSPPNDHLENLGKITVEDFNRSFSIDPLENIPLVDPSSELSVALRDTYKSSARSCDTYDASVPSYDGIDDQIPDQHLHPSVRKFKDGSFFNSKGLPSRDEIVVNNFVTGESGFKHQEMNFSLLSPGNKHPNMMVSKLHQDVSSNARKHSHPIRPKTRLDSDEHPSRPPLCSAHVTDSGSNHEFHNHSNFPSGGNPQYTDPDKVELLRMVYELQDELSRIYVPKENDGRFPAQVAWKDKQIPTYCSRLAPEGEINPDLRFPCYLGRCSQEGSRPHNCKGSGVAFSGKATCSRQGCFSLHCRSQDWHGSARLSQHAVCCSKGQCTTYPSHKCCHPLHSRPPSPRRYKGSEYSSRSPDAMFDDPWHNLNGSMKLYRKERLRLMKRHFRPIAGGAPIIACYHCSKLLQLPADFLLFRKRSHRLRCSSCSEVLTFSLQSKIHLVPCLPGSMAPPPGEIGEFNDDASRNNMTATSHSNGVSHAEPVAYSDNYGKSTCRSYSTDADPFHPIGSSPNHRKMYSVDSFESVDERKKFFLRKSLNPWRSFEKSSSEEVKPGTGSALHRLLGYTFSLKKIIVSVVFNIKNQKVANILFQ